MIPATCTSSVSTTLAVLSASVTPRANRSPIATVSSHSMRTPFAGPHVARTALEEDRILADASFDRRPAVPAKSAATLVG